MSNWVILLASYSFVLEANGELHYTIIARYMAILIIDFNEYYVTTIQREFLTEENLVEFDESLVVCQVLLFKF